MSSDSFSKDLIKQAIVAEIDGQKFYKMLVQKTNNPDAKRKLQSLADDEVRHEDLLIKMYKDLHGEDVNGLPAVGVGVLSKFFAENRDKEDLSENQYIDMAIEAELAATNFYKDGAKNAPNDEIKKLCDGMATEEYSHFELLQAEKDAIAGNHFWFGYDDGAPMEM
ncbi:MAG: ferritin family protein [candidate division Zixibacteria bacterium]|nr:ferritin family protein [candidate division Zixibacteria bacterium]